MFHQPREATDMKITTMGIDLAKNVIQVHGVGVHLFFVQFTTVARCGWRVPNQAVKAPNC